MSKILSTDMEDEFTDVVKEALEQIDEKNYEVLLQT